MAGTWSATGGGLRFTPRFPFARATTYVLVRRAGTSGSGPAGPTGWTEVQRLDLAAPAPTPTTSVEAIHPSGGEVPENLLRLSVTFSAAMDEGSAAGSVHLEDEHGERIDGALLSMPPELWDRPRRRLTLLLDPGRTKRGLVPNVALGPPLAGSARVTLVVDAALRDAGGAPLVSGARRTYRVGPPVRARVDPEAWELTWPPVGTREPLVARLDRPLDRILLLRCLRVTSSTGAPVPGRVLVGPGEVEWSFVPVSGWSSGDLNLNVVTSLEDLAGNSVRRVFDRDLRRLQDDPLTCSEMVWTPDGPTYPRG